MISVVNRFSSRICNNARIILATNSGQTKTSTVLNRFLSRICNNARIMLATHFDQTKTSTYTKNPYRCNLKLKEIFFKGS